MPRLLRKSIVVETMFSVLYVEGQEAEPTSEDILVTAVESDHLHDYIWGVGESKVETVEEEYDV